jgi:hypothetical protein
VDARPRACICSRSRSAPATADWPDGVPVLAGRRLALRDAAKTLLPEVGHDHGDIGIGFQVLRCVRKARLAVRRLFRAYDSESRPSRRSEWFRTTAGLRVGVDGKPRVRGTSRTVRRARIVLFKWAPLTAEATIQRAAGGGPCRSGPVRGAAAPERREIAFAVVIAAQLRPVASVGEFKPMRGPAN